MIYFHNDNKFDIRRYPTTKNNSLRAWNAADEYIIKFIVDISLYNKNVVLYNDRFGFLATVLADYNPLNVICHKSQELAIRKNFEINSINGEKSQNINVLRELGKEVDVAFVKVPKSMELFRLYLQHLSKNITDNSLVVCGFMTKYFTKQMLNIASEYFEDVSQSLAWKKSRLLYLRKPKKYNEINIINEIALNENQVMKQYFGVFSAEKIDPATQFLIDNIQFEDEGKTILDLGAGNGILTKVIADKNPKNEFHLIDDFFLAVESQKLNLVGDSFHFHLNDELSDFDNCIFDFVISNPPFHFEHEINIDVSLELFRQVYRCLKNGGEFQLVANQHLNYKTHLVKYFQEVEIIAENQKFVIYLCKKQELSKKPEDEFNYNENISESSE